MQADVSRTFDRRARLGWLAALAVTASLVAGACGGSGATPQIIYTILPPTPSPTATPAPSATPGPRGSAVASGSQTAATPTVSSTTVSAVASDGRWTSTFLQPVVGGVQTATTMNASIANRISAYVSSFTGSGLPVPASGDGPSTLKGQFSVGFASPGLLSLRFSVTTYVTGAAHPVTEVGSINFDVSTGAVIQLPDIFTSSAAALPILQSKAHAALSAKLGSDLNWPASITMSDFGKAWVFTPGGLELGWSQGDVASMAAGPVAVSIPWSALKTVLANPGPAAVFIH